MLDSGSLNTGGQSHIPKKHANPTAKGGIFSSKKDIICFIELPASKCRVDKAEGRHPPIVSSDVKHRKLIKPVMLCVKGEMVDCAILRDRRPLGTHRPMGRQSIGIDQNEN